MTKTFTDGKTFRKLILQHIRFGDSNKDCADFSAKSLSTNTGLYIGLRIYLTGLYSALDSIKDLGNELNSEDEQSAQASKKHFQKTFSEKKLNTLRSKPNDNTIRKYFLKALKNSKYLYYHVTDKANPYYHDKKCASNIMIVDKHKIYTNELCGYSSILKNYKRDLKKPRDKKSIKKAKQNIKYYFHHSSLPWSSKMLKECLKDPTGIKAQKKELNKFHKKAQHIIKEHHIKQYSTFKIVSNPNARDDTDEPRIMTINHNVFYYDPHKINKKYILYYNIPHLGKGIDNEVVDVVSADDHSIEEY